MSTSMRKRKEHVTARWIVLERKEVLYDLFSAFARRSVIDGVVVLRWRAFRHVYVEI